MSKESKMIAYSKVLEELNESSQPCHLLLGNGFNNSLGISTDYESIFEEMTKEEAVYEKIKLEIKDENYDIEKLIDKLKCHLKKEDSICADFLSTYLERKVKFDFMKAASSIVRNKIKGIYRENNDEIYLLFKNFSNYFTLNYDTFLYLLLMRFKKSDLSSPRVIALQHSPLSIQENLNEMHNNIYREIQEARRTGIITIKINDQTSSNFLNTSKKAFFQSIIEYYRNINNKNWKTKDIKAVCDQIWSEEANEAKLRCVRDGFQGNLFEIQNDQNIFFLHGSFHIYKKRKLIKKITQTQTKAFHEHLEEVVEANEKDVICVFTNKSESKINQIRKDKYLNKCFNKLSSLSGIIVILGSSLADNDSHIFNAINQSQISKIYISSSRKKESRDFKKASNFFFEKEIILFDRETISYNLSLDENI